MRVIKTNTYNYSDNRSIKPELQELIAMNKLVYLKTKFVGWIPANVTKITSDYFTVLSHNQKYELTISRKYWSEKGDKKKEMIVDITNPEVNQI